MTDLRDLRSAIPACGYCALCGALRYRTAGGIVCSDGCKQSVITPVPATMPLVSHPGVPDVPVCLNPRPECKCEGPHPMRKESHRAESYLVEELERAADLLREAAEHIRRSP